MKHHLYLFLLGFIVNLVLRRQVLDPLASISITYPPGILLLYCLLDNYHDAVHLYLREKVLMESHFSATLM